MKQRRFIRHTHPFGFRCGEWAEILTVAPAPDGTDCYVVRFPDGVTDWWRVVDRDERYEFSDGGVVLPDGVVELEREWVADREFEEERARKRYQSGLDLLRGDPDDELEDDE